MILGYDVINTMNLAKTKVCSKCGIEKPLNEFGKEKRLKHGLRCWCKSCCSEYNKVYNQINEKRVKAQKKEYLARPEIKAMYAEYRERNKNKKAEYDLMRTYNITIEQKQQMITDQNGLCGICRAKFKNQKDACVDHDHETGKIRGMLCKTCNKLLGIIEKQGFLELSMNYLNNHKDK